MNVREFISGTDARNTNWDVKENFDDNISDSKSIGSISEDSMNSTSSFSSSELAEYASSSISYLSTSSSSSSSSSQSNGSLYELSDLMNILPLKRGLSMFYQGKAQSFTSLARVQSIEDLPKKEKPYRKKMKPCKSFGYNIVLKEVLERGRFIKTIQSKHDQGLVKVYFKRRDFIDVADYELRISHINHIFRSIHHSHVWPFKLGEVDLLKNGIEELDSFKNWVDKQHGPGVQVFNTPVATGFQKPKLTDCDKLSEGYLLYSFNMDRHAMGISPEASDFPLQMSSLGVSSSSTPCMVHEPVSGSSISLEGTTAQTDLSGVPSYAHTSVPDCAKIWDYRKLEKDITFRGLGNVDKYSGISDITKKDIKEGSMLSLLYYPAHNFTIKYSTQNCGIHMWDTRSNSTMWTLKATPEVSGVSSLSSGLSDNWFVSGSSRGVLTLWDHWFLIPVNSLQYSVASPKDKICRFLRPPNSSQSSTARPLVYVASGCGEISPWNAENGIFHQVHGNKGNMHSNYSKSQV
ncbi:hypothetical protein TanjilG_32720 [Lupinus angustifolius]|uniref:Uncharacterized protein n=1 Tax=Lupinus angustifolius TaxID=3871 RepID=A0A4P1RFA2_LUPAN|nr:hypothetical protein TanjilG_32720 [Lupinus angustifolius]